MDLLTLIERHMMNIEINADTQTSLLELDAYVKRLNSIDDDYNHTDIPADIKNKKNVLTARLAALRNEIRKPQRQTRAGGPSRAPSAPAATGGGVNDAASRILNAKTIWEMLNLQPGAAYETVKKGHRQLVVELHPDKNRNKGDEERTRKLDALKKLNSAFDSFRAKEGEVNDAVSRILNAKTIWEMLNLQPGTAFETVRREYEQLILELNKNQGDKEKTRKRAAIEKLTSAYVSLRVTTPTQTL